jgi:hypothetical protein
VNHKYQPDFVIKHKGGEILVEFKGYFRDNTELMKYNWIRKTLTEKQELLFIFDRLNKPIHFKAIRKACGTKMTCMEWALKNNFACFNKETFAEYFNQLEF